MGENTGLEPRLQKSKWSKYPHVPIGPWAKNPMPPYIMLWMGCYGCGQGTHGTLHTGSLGDRAPYIRVAMRMPWLPHAWVVAGSQYPPHVQVATASPCPFVTGKCTRPMDTHTVGASTQYHPLSLVGYHEPFNTPKGTRWMRVH